MKKLLLAAILALTGCGLEAAGPYRNAVPSSETVQMKVPGSTGQAQCAPCVLRFWAS